MMRALTYLCLSLGFMFPGGALAFDMVIIPPEGHTLAIPSDEQILFGELIGESKVVRFRADAERTLTLQLFAFPHRPSGERFDAVLVNESRGDVAGILESGNLPWEEGVEPWTGESVLLGPVVTMTIPSGDYRLVVNSPGLSGIFGLRIDGNDEVRTIDMLRVYERLPYVMGAMWGKHVATSHLTRLGGSVSLILLCVGVILTLIIAHTIPFTTLRDSLTRHTRFRLGILLFVLMCFAILAYLLLTGMMLPICTVLTGMCLGWVWLLCRMQSA
jgi:uncharacterized membrane protein